MVRYTPEDMIDEMDEQELKEALLYVLAKRCDDCPMNCNYIDAGWCFIGTLDEFHKEREADMKKAKEVMEERKA